MKHGLGPLFVRFQTGLAATLAAFALCVTPVWAASHVQMANVHDSANVPLPGEKPERRGETGVASWYGGEFHGRVAASGEVFDQNAMTAAHPELPFDAEVRVTSLDTGQSVVLRINDRGPFADNRIIDVSRRAAQELGFLDEGTGEVRVEVLSTP